MWTVNITGIALVNILAKWLSNSGFTEQSNRTVFIRQTADGSGRADDVVLVTDSVAAVVSSAEPKC